MKRAEIDRHLKRAAISDDEEVEVSSLLVYSRGGIDVVHLRETFSIAIEYVLLGLILESSGVF